MFKNKKSILKLTLTTTLSILIAISASCANTTMVNNKAPTGAFMSFSVEEQNATPTGAFSAFKTKKY